MKVGTLYYNRTPFRVLFISELVVGSVVLSYFIYFFLNGIFIDFWSFAGPLLGSAMILTGLTSSKIKHVNLNVDKRLVEINKESLFSKTTTKIDVKNLRLELKSPNKGKLFSLKKLKLTIKDSDIEIEELNSNVLSLNNRKIQKLYDDLKRIVKAINSTSNSL